MRHLARHRILSQSYGIRKDARTDQSMPHRRSSDVANAVWLIYEGTIYPDIHFAINNEFDKTHRHCDAFLSLQSNPRLVSTRAHKDTDIERWKDQTLVEGILALTGESPAVAISVKGTTCLSITSLDSEWQYAAACFRPSLPSKSACSYKAANMALPDQCFFADRLCLTLCLAYLTPKCQILDSRRLGQRKDVAAYNAD